MRWSTLMGRLVLTLLAVLLIAVPTSSFGAPPPDDATPPPDDATPPPDGATPPPDGATPPPDDATPPDVPPGDGSGPEASTASAPNSPPDGPAPEADEPGGAPSILPGTGCDLRNRGDPLYPVAQALSLMRTTDLELLDCQQVVETGRGPRMIEAQLRGPDQDLLLYRLERLAADGFEVYLAPLATHEVLMAARPAISGGGVFYAEVEKVDLHGTFVQGDDRNRLETIIGLRQGSFYPFEYSTRLAELGYRAEFYPVAKGEVVIEVRPGRSIRRVRIRGQTPLAKRDIMRQLSIDAQPGALARGQCVEPKRLRQGDPPPICDGRDVACLEWERDEVERLDQFLFDSGFFDGSTQLALVCGRASDEADLYVFLDKGKAYKVDRRRVKVRDLDAEKAAAEDGDTGEPLEERDIRWIRRQFIPKVLGVFRTRISREFMDRAERRVVSAYADPNAGLGRFWRSEAATPHPQVEVNTSYDDLDAKSERDSHNIPLEVRVARGPAVHTEFKPARGAKTRRGRDSGLSFSNGQLRNHIQLFNRREPASPAAAERASANIRAFYQSKGYLFARVEGRHLDFKSMDKLRFEIAEGPKVEVAEISITRPARLSNEVAKRIERTWEDERRLRKRRKFSESDALADIQSVLAAYNAEGYLCADVYIYLGFWAEALEDPAPDPSEEAPRVRATLRIQDLLDSGGQAKWIEQFDETGLAGVMTAEHAEIWVRVLVDPGPRLVTAASEDIRFLEQSIPFSRKIEDPLVREPRGLEQATEIIERSPLRLRGQTAPGQVPITPSLEREVRRSLVAQYRNRGYPIADAELTWAYTSPGGVPLSADTARNLPDSRFGICHNRGSERQVEVVPVVNLHEGKIGEFGEILFRGNFKTRDWVLRRELEFETGQRYDQRLVDTTAASIEATGVAKSVTVTPYPVGCDFEDPGVCQVHQVISFEEAKDISVSIDFGFGAATLNPLFVFVNPSFPNLWGTGWDLSFEGRYGLNLVEVLGQNSGICSGQECFERLAATTLSRPHVLGTDFDLDINGRFQQRATPARGRILSIVGSLRVSRRFREWTFYTGYLFQLANVSKDLVKPLGGTNGGWINRGGGVVSDLTGLLDTGVVVTHVDNAFNPHDGFIATMDVKLASPWLGGLDWWARLDLSWQHFIPLRIPGTQERISLRYALRYGHLIPFHGPGFGGRDINTDTVPDVWRYYGGGTADLGLRGILPETMLVDIEEIQLPYGGVVYRPRAQGGHIRAIGTLALQVTSVRDIFGGALAHSIFYDFGVLTQFWDKFNLARDFRHSIGSNFIKLDIGIVTMALGYAFLLPGRYNVGPTDDPNGRFIFDVGVTF